MEYLELVDMTIRKKRSDSESTASEVDLELDTLHLDELEEMDSSERLTRAITPQTDDPSMPAFTFRSLLIGSIWAVFLSGANILFSFRTNWFTVPSGLAQLLAHPMGVFLARILPSGILNPGPFTAKEHVLIYVIASSAGGLPWGVDNVVIQYAQPYMADSNINFWNSIMWVASLQFVGYGVAGICRRFLVSPSAMLWPTVLPNVALFSVMNGLTMTDEGKFKISRYTTIY